MDKIKKIFSNNIYLTLIALATLFMSIGYASINSITMDIVGLASIASPEGIYISSVTVDEENTQGGVNVSNDIGDTFINSNIILENNLSSNLTIVVEICNKYSDDRIFNSLNYLDPNSDLIDDPTFSTMYTNKDIIIDEQSYSAFIGTILPSNDCINVPIKFKYSSDIETVTNNSLNINMNFKFDTIETYSSNISYQISSNSGTFASASTQLDYELTVINNNPYPIKFNTLGSNTDDVLLNGIDSNLDVLANDSTVTTITLSPAKDLYTTATVTSAVSIKVISPVEIPANEFIINIETFGSNLTDLILASNEIVTTTPSFSTNVTTKAGSGLYQTTDESGTTYYFRGLIDNNYVYFADKMWRILRINGDGSYRLILNSSAGTAYYSTSETDTYNVGYMYGNTVRANTNSSNIKTWLEDWYSNNLDSYDQYIDKDAIFWNDRTMSSTSNVFAGWIRIVNNAPSLMASTVADMFSVTTTKGNGLLTKPIGLITADEIVLAGGTMTNASATGYGTYYENNAYFIYTDDTPTYGIWTMTPRRLAGPVNNHMIVSKPQAIIYSEPAYSVKRYVKPVINLKKTVKFNGDGTAENPYIVY